MKASKLVTGDYRKKEGYVPTKHFSQMDYVVENKKGLTRAEKRQGKHFTGQKNTQGYNWGYNQKSWMEFCKEVN